MIRFVVRKPLLVELAAKYGILCKGGGLPPGSIRVCGGVKYKKFGPGDWRKLVEKKEPWDSSDGKAKELTIADFGMPEEVSEMARMPIEAKGYAHVRGILLEIAGKPLQSKSGLTATITRNSIDKLLSGKSIEGSFEKQSHLTAAANLARLFSNAVEPWKFELNPEKTNAGIQAVRRLYAPMYFSGRIVPVKITVKEMKNPKDGNRIYTLRTIDVDVEKNIGM